MANGEPLNSELDFREHLKRMDPGEKLDFVALETRYQRIKLDDFCKRFDKVEREHEERNRESSQCSNPVTPRQLTVPGLTGGGVGSLATAVLILLLRYFGVI